MGAAIATMATVLGMFELAAIYLDVADRLEGTTQLIIPTIGKAGDELAQRQKQLQLSNVHQQQWLQMRVLIGGVWDRFKSSFDRTKAARFYRAVGTGLQVRARLRRTAGAADRGPQEDSAVAKIQRLCESSQRTQRKIDEIDKLLDNLSPVKTIDKTGVFRVHLTNNSGAAVTATVKYIRRTGATTT